MADAGNWLSLTKKRWIQERSVALQGAQLEGEEELIRKIRNLGDSVKGTRPERLFLRAAKMVRNKMRETAPQGPTGNLRKGIVARTLARKGRKVAPAMVGINYRLAPHAILLEFGTAKMSPRPFFRRTLIETQARVNKMLTKGFKKIIEKEAKKGNVV